jgi:general stress protein CsbA
MFRQPDALQAILLSLQNSAIATAIREGETLFPWIECLHVLALTIVIGSIAIVDSRLIGLTSRDRTVAQTTAAVLPVTWSAFVMAALTGGLLFASNAVTYSHNRYFQIKMALIALAGINMLGYHLIFAGRRDGGRTALLSSRSDRVVGAISLCLWIGVVACGRWIGFTINAVT